ncbi:hypothetical protein PPERSA_11023 [Pseudocohnilembus persalinus]|uniref:Uncharacterized protein n=1 Tax=Pseudocohnilembus persalinus TaxID=266149 RepID=A0A0V0QYY0_PSEPJ|nr:hypothetical protein PPERSA_11023 [Pseudocohnilembus persalinus]|eukprot:KRX07474.1 hypothetical protein PPERSA_11023 [Pseudocohnilembus persalinus]
MTCLKNEHYHQQFQFFKFTENLEEMLQCFSCFNEDPQLNKKISIDQILKFPVSKIQNFPPLKDQDKDKQVRQIMEDFTQEKIKKFKEYIKKQIEQHYEQKIKILNQSKKDVIIKFEQIMEFTDVSQYYNIDQLKAAINQYKNKQMNLEELFQEQLKMKKDFECEKKCKVMFFNQQKQEQIINQINILKQQLDQKFKTFTDEKIKINIQELRNIQRNIDQALLNKSNQHQQHLQYYQYKYLEYLSNLQDKQHLQHQQCQQQFLQDYQIQFHKSNYQANKKDEIKIQHNHTNKIKIEIDNKTKDHLPKKIYSDGLDKNKTCHFKIKVNFHQQKDYSLFFCLIGSQDKDKSWLNQNFIELNDGVSIDFAGNGGNNIIKGQKFVDFWKDGETVLNIVLNVNEKLFEIYDGQRKGYVKNFIDQSKIKGEQVMLGMLFYKYTQQKIDLEIYDVQVF